MPRQATSKYGFWLAGYYEDFLGSRCIADDSNQPSTDSVYDATLTHHGNTMNGEATLNPRYRWSVRDRANNDEFSNATNYLLTNDGISRWATFDQMRLGKGSEWVSRSQPQYPSSLAHPNRLRFDDTPHNTASTADTYLMISSSSDSNAKYYLPCGDTDASFGRRTHFAFNPRTYEAGKAGYTTGTSPNFMQYAHMTGVWMGERLQAGSYTSGGAESGHQNTPEKIFTPIKSLGGKPFLCVTTYMEDDSAHQLNNVGPAGAYRPVIAYANPLNSRSTGDYFTIRLACHAMKGDLTMTNVVGLAEGINTSVIPQYILKVGFPANTTFGTTGSGGGTAAIEWTFGATNGDGGGGFPFYHALYDAGRVQPEEEPWQDYDFKFIGSNKFKVYHNGIEVTATNATAGAYSSGYTLKNNTQTSAAFNQDELTGWELFTKGLGTTGGTGHTNCLIDTMIDRVALYRPLTDMPDGTGSPAPVDKWDCSLVSNGVSQASIVVLDDDTEQNLTPWFTNDDVCDWRLLLFNDSIHRPIWNGVINRVDVKQSANKRTREVTISATDSLGILDRQIAAWEVGQIGLGESDTVLARRSEISNLSESMFLGAAKLESSLPTLGFEASTGYKELHQQRMRLNTAHPIQMYNNEDVRGPNNVERDWLGYRIKGFDNPSGTVTVAIMEGTGTGFSDGDTVVVTDSESHNKASGTIPSSGTANAVHNTDSNYYSNVRVTNHLIATNIQAITLTGVTYANHSFDIEGYGTYDPTSSLSSGAISNTGFVIYRFPSQPTRADGTKLKVGDYFTVASKGNASYFTGTFMVKATLSYLGKWYAKTDLQTTHGVPIAFTAQALEFSIDTGYIRPASTDLKMRTAHPVWMRQLADSPWFRKHFAVYENAVVDALETDGATTASATQIQFTGSHSGDSRVGQIVDSDGFVDTFTFVGKIGVYLVGVNGLSKDHPNDSPIYILGVNDDYKHLWLQWADMRNNGDADANGGYKKKTVGLMKPIADNYDVSISFTDQYEDDGSFTDFTDLKIGSDLDMWELDSEVDPSTGIPFSLPLKNVSTKAIANGSLSGGDAGAINGPIVSSYEGGAYTGKAYFNVANADKPAVGDKVLLGNVGVYNGHHTVLFVSTASYPIIVLDVVHTADVAYSATVPPWFHVLQAENSESELRSWEDTGGSLVVYDCSKFFNLNTFINGGTYGQDSGGRVNIGDYETEYHGFPVLMDNYWVQAASTTLNNAAPYGDHDNYRLWNGSTAELNRTVEVGDTVIETKASTSLISSFEDYGYGKIKGTRGAGTATPSSEVFWYVYDGKLDTAVVESASGATSFAAGVMTITCSGADFLVDGIRTGMRVRNVTQKWVAIITEVTATTLRVIGVNITLETGGVLGNVASSDSISIPQQLFGCYIEPDSNRGRGAEEAEEYLEEVHMNDSLKRQGSLMELAVNAATQQNATGAFDQVVIVASVSPRYALRFLMKVNGFVTSPNIGTYWFSDKVRFLWSFMLSNTWLAQASVPCWYDIASVPLTNNMTTDGTNSNWDSFGSAADMRGGKSILSIIKQSNESTGFGYNNSLRLPMTWQIGRDNKIEVRPTYNLGEVVNRDILSVSSMQAEMGSHTTNVRVYYNNGASFADYPAPTLNQSYRWKIVEMPEVGTESEALSIAKEQYYQAKKKAIKVAGNVLRDTTFDDKMLHKGRYGYVADPYRHTERGVTAGNVFNATNNDVHARSSDRNAVWCSVNGIMFCGTQNALDGQMLDNGADAYRRDRYGAGITTQGTSATGTIDYDDNFYWWGANSLAHAVQIVHIPTGTPLTSDAVDADDLRIWVALKDAQTGTDIDNATFTVGITDVAFNKEIPSAFAADYTYGGSTSNVQFSPTMAVADKQTTTVDVSRNGFYEIAIPANYWDDMSGTPKIVISVNVDYLKDILRHRCGDPASASILHNAHNINTETGVSNWTATNANSLFPLGMRKYSNMTGAFDTRVAWYAPRINIVPDIRWRPATTVAFTDSGLGLSAEAMVITKVKWDVKGNSIESVQLDLERDQTKDKGGLASFLYPTVSRGRGSPTVGGGGGGGTTAPPSGTPDVPPSTGGGTGGGTGTPYVPPSLGPIGSTAFTPSQMEGGRFQQMGGGAFSNSVSGNMLASGIHAKVAGRMDLLENGLSDSSFGLLGQARSAPPTNTQRSVEGIGDSLFAASATSTMSSEGMVFSGIVNPESSNRETQSHSISIRVPDDVADEIITISGSYSLGGVMSDRAIVDITATCEETSSSITRTVTFSGAKENQNINLLNGNLTGANTKGNNITITLKRTSGTGADTATYSSLVMHNISANFQRYSLKGLGTGSQGFKPY